ncbi:MAG: hypothetical protein IJ520_11305 [Synergistaceae bacterium]|nr:hypothetical protein [Synergistaceae bacterium]
MELSEREVELGLKIDKLEQEVSNLQGALVNMSAAVATLAELLQNALEN